MPECRSCHAPVVWVQVKRLDGSLGARMMVDADPDTGEPAELPDGNVRSIGWHTDEQGRRSPMVQVTTPGAGSWRSHFASCPNADRHRRR